MKPGRIFSTIILIAVLITACSSASPSNSEGETGQSVTQPNQVLRAAQADNAILLEWTAIDGAENYLLEYQSGDVEFIPLAYLGAVESSFVDYQILPGATYTYKLTSIDSSNREKSYEVELTAPEVTGAPIQVTLEMDSTPAAFDFSSFTGGEVDPESFDPSVLENLFPTDESGEPAEIDPSMFLDQAVEKSSVVGPDGGEVSVTGTNGVTYSLYVPRDALRMEVPIRLMPVSAINDLPLSGGLGAAVIIEPEGMVFDIPAVLTISPPGETAPVSGGENEILLGFAFQSDGNEFHLYPRLSDIPQAASTVQMARLLRPVKQAGPLAEIARLQLEQAGGYGVGSGTKEDVEKIRKKPPTRTSRRVVQEAALAEVEELAPLLPPEELAPVLSPQAMASGKIGKAILDRAGKATDWSKFMEVLEDFRVYMNSGGDKYNRELNSRIIDIIVKNAKALLDKNIGQCLTPDDFMAQDLVERLVNPKDNFSKLLSGSFSEKYGQKLLTDLVYGMKKCKFELDLNSKLTFGKLPDQIEVTNTFEKLPLQLTYSNGEIYLWGSTTMKLTTRVKGFCAAEIKQYDDLRFVVDRMEPIFNGQRLTDLNLTKYRVFGWQKYKGSSGSGDNCPQVIKIQGGGDFWTGLFTIARITLDGMALSGWDVRGSSEITAKWISNQGSFRPYNEDTVMSENTLFTFRAVPENRSR